MFWAGYIDHLEPSHLSHGDLWLKTVHARDTLGSQHVFENEESSMGLISVEIMLHFRNVRLQQRIRKL